MKCLLSVLLIIVLVLPLRAFSESPQTVGVSLPLTGPAATYGVDLRNIFTFLNDKLGKGEFQLAFEDDRCDPKEAALIAQRFTTIQRVKFVIGLPCSGVMLAAAPIYDRAGVMAISAMAGSPKISTAGDFIFRTRPTDMSASQELNRYITKKHSSLGVLVEQTEYALGMLTAFTAVGVPKTFSLLTEEYAPNTADFRSSLNKLRSRQVAALLILPQTEQAMIIAIKQLREMNWNVPVYSNWVTDSRTFLNAAGPQAEGIIFATLPGAERVDSGEGQKLYQEFLSQYGPLNSVRGGFECGYNAYVALLTAARAQGDPRQALYSTEIQGFGGKFTFDKNGDITGLSFALRVNKGGEAMVVENN